MIAFIGSVFSPYYAWARRRGPADPENHCALNVALYGNRKAWAMTERGRAALHRTPDTLTLGPSALVWDGTSLTIRIDEVSMPIPRRIRGTVRVIPSALTGHCVQLDQHGRHRWSPLAPVARVEVDMRRPAIRWSGSGYLDMNVGDAPLEQDFARWDWSCARIGDGAAVLYDVTPRHDPATCFGLHFDPTGAITPFPPPPLVRLPPTGWRVARGIRAEAGTARVARTFEDTPFYARSAVASQLLGHSVTAMHESLSLDRFRTGIVQALLPFRMPRAGGAGIARATDNP